MFQPAYDTYFNIHSRRRWRLTIISCPELLIARRLWQMKCEGVGTDLNWDWHLAVENEMPQGVANPNILVGV